MTIAGQEVNNIFHYALDHDFNNSDLDQLADDLIAIWDPTIMQFLSDDVNFVGVTCTDLSSASGPVRTQTTGGSPGLIASPAVPNNSVIAFTWRTGFRGRSYRGRTFLGGYPISKLDDSTHINDVWVQDTVAGFSTMVGPTLMHGAVLGVLSLQHDKAARTEGVLTQIETVDANNVIDSMRRRLAGRGS